MLKEVKAQRDEKLLDAFLDAVDYLVDCYARGGLDMGYKREGRTISYFDKDDSYMWAAIDGMLHLFHYEHDVEIQFMNYPDLDNSGRTCVDFFFKEED